MFGRERRRMKQGGTFSRGDIFQQPRRLHPSGSRAAHARRVHAHSFAVHARLERVRTQGAYVYYITEKLNKYLMIGLRLKLTLLQFIIIQLI